MRKYMVFTLGLVAVQALAAEPMQVDGVAITGKTDAVSVSDIRDAIKAFDQVSDTKPASLVVLDRDHMRGYSQSRDVGWFSLDKTIAVEPDGTQHPGPWDAYGQNLPYDPQAMECIRHAQQVYVFPITTPLDPHRDDVHMRLLDKDARDDLVDLLEDKRVWMQGLNSLRYPPVKGQTVGLVFRDGEHELVLFYKAYGRLAGTFDGEHLGGDFDPGQDDYFDIWERRYAQPELDYRERK